jgi:hypothetical protein
VSDLRNLLLVSKLLHEYTIPELYRSITFFASNKQNLVELGVNSFLTRNTRHIKHIKELYFDACFHRDLRTRCPGGTDLVLVIMMAVIMALSTTSSFKL